MDSVDIVMSRLETSPVLMMFTIYYGRRQTINTVEGISRSEGC